MGGRGPASSLGRGSALLRLIASSFGLLHLIAAYGGRLLARAGLRLVGDGLRLGRVVGRGVCRYAVGLAVRGFLARRS